MAYLIVRNRCGQEILTRELSVEDSDRFYKAWMDAETVLLNGMAYRLHSVARTRPARNLVLCVSPEASTPPDIQTSIPL